MRRELGHTVGLRSCDDAEDELPPKTKEVMTERFATRRLIPSYQDRAVSDGNRVNDDITHMDCRSKLLRNAIDA